MYKDFFKWIHILFTCACIVILIYPPMLHFIIAGRPLQSFAREHMQAVQENTAAVEHREQEIKNIAQSITDLNMIFKDLAAMIVDQVGVIIRIHVSHSLK